MTDKYKAAVFDLDGTLFNTKKGIVKAIKKAIEVKGLHQLSEKEFDQFIGPPIQQTFSKVFNLSEDEGNEIAAVFRNFYHLDEYILEADEYAGMKDTLKLLNERGYHLALATFKREEMAVNICRHFGYDVLMSSIHGSDTGNSRTKSDIIKLCLKDLEVDASKAVMIGDSSFDAEGAEAAGMDFVGVTYGFGFDDKSDIERFSGAVAVDCPEGLLGILA